MFNFFHIKEWILGTGKGSGKMPLLFFSSDMNVKAFYGLHEYESLSGLVVQAQ